MLASSFGTGPGELPGRIPRTAESFVLASIGYVFSPPFKPILNELM
jgi:hypothetical protein